VTHELIVNHSNQCPVRKLPRIAAEWSDSGAISRIRVIRLITGSKTCGLHARLGYVNLNFSISK